MILTIQQIDDNILNFIQTKMNFSFFDKIMPFISQIGNLGMIWITIAILLIFLKKHRLTGVVMIIALMLSVITGSIVLKPLVSRLRPCDVHPEITLLIPRPTDFSFPSGHTMSSFAAATVIFISNKKYGKYALALALSIAYSRLYLYVHYPSDILGGIILGVLIGVISFKIFKLIKNSTIYNLAK